jgi:pentatricopeptide repeat protein
MPVKINTSNFNAERTESNNQLGQFARRKKLKEAETLFAKMEEKNQTNEVSFAVMMNAFVRCGQIEAAENILVRMVKQGYHASVISYTTLMKGLCSAGRLQDAVALLDRMEAEEVKPNIRTFNTLLRGCLTVGGVKEAQYVFERLRATRDCSPDGSSLEMMTTLLCQGSKFKV